MNVAAFIVCLVLLEYYGMIVGVGRARGKYKINAPATVGHPIFERHFRVQQNTMEQLIIFLPSFFIFSNYWEGALALSLIGGLFIVGRAVYWYGYVQDPKKRAAGFLMTALAQAAVVFGGLWGAILALREVGLAG